MFPKANGLSSLFSAVFKPTADINDLYSINDEIACIIIIITGDDLSLIPESYACQWSVYSKTSSLLLTSYDGYVA